jgi:hypothetical protein
LRIVLTGFNKAYVLDADLGDAPGKKADTLNVCEAHTYNYRLIKCPVLTSLEPEFHKYFEIMLGHLKLLK